MLYWRTLKIVGLWLNAQRCQAVSHRAEIESRRWRTSKRRLLPGREPKTKRVVILCAFPKNSSFSAQTPNHHDVGVNCPLA
jgi:hypothetical protein